MNINSRPKISVVIPVFNGEKFIAEAIQSVLDQNYEPLEIIVVDDGSTDNTMSIVKAIPGNILYTYQENKGIPAARNAGLKIASGEIIAFNDSDDLWSKNKLAIQMEIFRQLPENDIVMGFLLKVQETEIPTVTLLDADNKKGEFATQLCLMLIRKKVFDIIGNFNEKMYQAEDVDWFFRAMEANIKNYIHQDVVLYYRQHQNNITKDKKRMYSYLLKAYKLSIERRKKRGDTSLPPFPKPDNLDAVIKYWKNK